MDKTVTILKISFSSSICRQKLVVFWSAREVQNYVPRTARSGKSSV